MLVIHSAGIKQHIFIYTIVKRCIKLWFSYNTVDIQWLSDEPTHYNMKQLIVILYLYPHPLGTAHSGLVNVIQICYNYYLNQVHHIHIR